MGGIIALICGFFIACIKWAFIDFPLIVIKFWGFLIKKVWSILPLFAIALGIAVAEIIIMLLATLILSKSANNQLMNLFEIVGKVQFDEHIGGIVIDIFTKCIENCTNFIDNPNLSIFSKAISAIIGIAVMFCLLGVIIFLIITMCIVLSWKFLLAALIINLIINLIKYIVVTRQSKLPVE